MLAAVKGHEEVVEDLLSRKANTELKCEVLTADYCYDSLIIMCLHHSTTTTTTTTAAAITVMAMIMITTSGQSEGGLSALTYSFISKKKSIVKRILSRTKLADEADKVG